MTTENTDAATRILTKTIRKLAEQLAEADRMTATRLGIIAEDQHELARVSGVLIPDAEQWEDWALEGGGLVKLAQKRMAELAEERDKRKSAEEGRRLVGDRMVDLEERIERALASLEGTGSAVARVHAARRALRGDA